MNIFKTPTGETSLDPEVAEVRKLLWGVRDVLSSLRDRLENEDIAATGETGKVLSELRHLIRTAIDTEKRFDERQKEKDGIANDYRLDLDDARATIGSRLARLRAASDQEELY